MYLAQYANVLTRWGYPKIVGWRQEYKLREMWARISYSPDTKKVASELPPENNQDIIFPRPSLYPKVLASGIGSDGRCLETPTALCSELRRTCFSDNKEQWIEDFISGLDTNCVIYYNFVSTGDKIEEILRKVLPQDAEVWRIDGRHHKIPTIHTIHSRDVVLCQWQSGSEALNLQFVNYWVSAEPCYSYLLNAQAKGRIRRIGQLRPQFYYYLKTEGTIEEAIYDCLAEKREFSEKNWCIQQNIIEEGEKYV